ncbi:hypothetical protein COCON_G00114100 [Conger conger]|uniref:Aryl hydrocarbon receptor nuclear translocator like 2 n=1 Tax=Conger conger TaxID=82655 RepID=A0A9Q1DFK9_CONCO|nr:hypothetical protein COCON_G00114100 [Conger conger]
MSAGDSAAGGGDGADGERTGEVLLEDSSSLSVSLSGLMSPTPSASEQPRKRKGSMDQDAADVNMEDEPDRSEGEEQLAKIKCFREPHSQIEKRRRDKMNNLIDELSAMIPSCSSLPRKLDKLTVLRMAVQHLKSLKGAGGSFSEAHYKPSFLPDDEVKHLILRAADGFLFVVGCDRGKILFMSESVSKILNYNRTDLIGQSLFDYVHPKDIGKVKEQLSSSELYPRERLIDAKTGLQVQAELPVASSRLCSGARRAFFCRMKYNRVAVKLEAKELPSSSKRKESQRYCTVHCTGYLRSWPSSQLGAVESEGEAEKEGFHFSCLVAIGRVHPLTVPQANGEVQVKPTEFVTRYAIDGKFTFVDQRATTILGYLPQELLGTSCYEYFHQDDLPQLAERHRKVLRSKEKIETNRYKFKTKYGSFVTLQSQWFSFINPWTKEVEYIVSTNTVISGPSRTGTSAERPEQPGDSRASEEDAKKAFSIIPGIPSGSGTMIYAGCIGTQIANEMLDFNRLNSSPSSGNVSPFSLAQDKSPLMLSLASSTTLPNGEVTEAEHAGKLGCHTWTWMCVSRWWGPHLDLDTVVGPGLGNLSNDEAAMAVIMSLLESDGNLGDTVDFDEMHWSL